MKTIITIIFNLTNHNIWVLSTQSTKKTIPLMFCKTYCLKYSWFVWKIEEKIAISVFEEEEMKMKK